MLEIYIIILFGLSAFIMIWQGKKNRELEEMNRKTNEHIFCKTFEISNNLRLIEKRVNLLIEYLDLVPVVEEAKPAKMVLKKKGN